MQHLQLCATPPRLSPSSVSLRTRDWMAYRWLARLSECWASAAATAVAHERQAGAKAGLPMEVMATGREATRHPSKALTLSPSCPGPGPSTVVSAMARTLWSRRAGQKDLEPEKGSAARSLSCLQEQRSIDKKQRTGHDHRGLGCNTFTCCSTYTCTPANDKPNQRGSRMVLNSK